MGEDVIEMERLYKPATRGKAKTEFMYDRLFFGMLSGTYGNVQRQVRALYSGKQGRIDFQIGPTKTGTFIELAIGAKASGNKTELYKLSRQNGRQRVLMLLNVGLNAVDMDGLKKAFGAIKPTRGKLPTRNNVRIVVCGPVKCKKKTGRLSDYSFVWLGSKSRTR